MILSRFTRQCLRYIFASVMHTLPPYCAIINISLLRSFKFCNIFVSKTWPQDFKTKRFVNSTALKLFTKFLHYAIMLFQADTVARTVQYRFTRPCINCKDWFCLLVRRHESKHCLKMRQHQLICTMNSQCYLKDNFKLVTSINCKLYFEIKMLYLLCERS